MAAWLQAASEPAPVLFVLDDLHRGDELSLLLVQHVLRAETLMRLLVVATYATRSPAIRRYSATW